MFKDRAAGVQFTRTISFRNNSSNDLTISAASASCGCIEVTDFTPKITHSGVGQVKFVLNALRMLRGIHTYQYRIVFADSASPDLVGLVQYDYEPDIEFSTEHLEIDTEINLGADVAITGYGSCSVRIRDETPRGFTILDVSVDSPYVKTMYSECRQTDVERNTIHYFDIGAIAVPGCPLGKSDYTLLIRTTSPDHPVLKFPITVNLRAPFEAVPGAIILREAKSEKFFRRSFIIRSLTPSAKFVSVKASRKDWSVKLVRELPDNEFHFEISGPLAADGEVTTQASALQKIDVDPTKADISAEFHGDTDYHVHVPIFWLADP